FLFTGQERQNCRPLARIPPTAGLYGGLGQLQPGSLFQSRHHTAVRLQWRGSLGTTPPSSDTPRRASSALSSPSTSAARWRWRRVLAASGGCDASSATIGLGWIKL
ncbi:Breast cancer type 2 susceptibility protein-like protein, partial [Frankliniella fusca]